jgi:hypothetical protein
MFKCFTNRRLFHIIIISTFPILFEFSKDKYYTYFVEQINKCKV